MSAILQRLNKREIHLPSATNNGSAEWVFGENLTAEARKNPNLFRRIVNNLPSLKLEYDVQCARLIQDVAKKNKPMANTIEQVKSTLMLAEILETVYRDYLNVPREVTPLRKDQLILRKLLQAQYHFDSRPLKVEHPRAFSKQIRDTTLRLNLPRLLTFRSRRLFLAIKAIAPEHAPYHQFIGFLNKWANPALSYIAWLFYVPRLSDNLIMTGKNTLPYFWKADPLKLGKKLRLQAELERRWADIINDSVWLTAGLINCFVLVGALSGAGIYFAVLMQGFDLILACTRILVETHRMRTLQNEYKKLLQEFADFPEHCAEIHAYQMHLNQRIALEQKKLLVGALSNCVLVLAIALAIPAFSLHPAIPIAAAAVAVFTTVAAHLLMKHLEAQKPCSKLQKLQGKEHGLGKHAFFSSPDLKPKPALRKSHSTGQIPTPTVVETPYEKPHIPQRPRTPVL